MLYGYIPSQYYIYGATVRYEDDEGINALNIYCKNRAGYVTSVMVYGGKWWRPAFWSESKLVTQAQVCVRNYLVIPVDDHVGSTDHTAMNGLRFVYETPTNWN